ncbi:hypothetical protein AC578_11034 [Pseudocercospora eumusae]|uniref:Apple domain-containing protein n=1 Tax=Pseudocercospora eumusae TaxID=321146 RepID=A0A139HSV5_9PEZI|nr:hypothetical protein AC578_11034 [Pseudocercospora eumusae]
MSANVIFRALLTFIIGLTFAIQLVVAQSEQNEKVICGAESNHKILQSGGFADAIKKFCSQPLLFLETNYSPDRHFYQQPDYGTPYENNAGGANGSSFKLEVRWGDFGYQTGCRDKQAFKVGRSECEQKLNTVAGSCPSSDMGYLSENAGNGCVLWKVEGVKLTS